MTPEEIMDLAKKHAPILCQKVSKEWQVADMIAPIDFTGSLNDLYKNPYELTKLNPDDIDQINPKVYFSLCETDTHYFIIYAVYHIMDWHKRLPPNNLWDLIMDALGEHIHDMEGALFIITKEPEEIIDGVITIAHDNFYLYTNPLPKEDGENEPGQGPNELRLIDFKRENIDGHIRRHAPSKRVKLYIETKGHGIYGTKAKWGGGDDIWYFRPQGEVTDPRSQKTIEPPILEYGELEKGYFKDYELIDIHSPEGLWENRFNKHVFLQNKKGRWGFVYYDGKEGEPGKNFFGGSANPPWSWNDHNDPSPIGIIATDPARLILQYAEGWGPVSTHYLYNKYLEIT